MLCEERSFGWRQTRGQELAILHKRPLTRAVSHIGKGENGRIGAEFCRRSETDVFWQRIERIVHCHSERSEMPQVAG